MNDAPSMLAALGGPTFRDTLTVYLQQGEAGLAALLDALLAKSPIGAPRADHRSVCDDFEETMRAFAARHPAGMLNAIKARPDLAGWSEVLAGLSVIPGEEAAALLREALASRNASLRWRALESLTRRGDPRLCSHMDALLLDRDTLVAFEARQWALHHGTAEHLPALFQVLRKMPLVSGHYVRVMDIIEVICLRQGLPLPQGFPQRLRTVALPAEVQLDGETEHVLYPTGVPMGEGPDGPFLAPEDWFVVLALPPAAEGGGIRLVLRDLSDARTWEPPAAERPPAKRSSKGGRRTRVP